MTLNPWQHEMYTIVSHNFTPSRHHFASLFFTPPNPLSETGITKLGEKSTQDRLYTRNQARSGPGGKVAIPGPLIFKVKKKLRALFAKVRGEYLQKLKYYSNEHRAYNTPLQLSSLVLEII